MTSMAELDRAIAHLDPPFGVLDLDAFDRNAAALERRAGGKPIRVASKSVRSRELIGRVLARPGYAGILAYTLPEAMWLAADHDDVVVGYPTADRAALRALAADPLLASRVSVMVDSVEHLDFIEATLGAATGGPRIRICLDLDASLRALGGRLHLGVRRSPVHSPAQLGALAAEAVRRPRLKLVGVMCYEGQIAGLADHAGVPPRRAAVKVFQRISADELRERRALAVAAVEAIAPLEFVNGGGTGSLERTSSEDVVTDVAAGSGLFGPHLFDHYAGFTPEPAAFFVLPVVRRPSASHATVLGGGWIASGPTGDDRQPLPYWPAGLSLVASEGAGEVQTPVVGDAVREMRIGDRVWFRHCKAGELCEHVDALYPVESGKVGGRMATYRGEAKTFL